MDTGRNPAGTPARWRTVLMLGKNGDLINLSPVLREMAQQAHVRLVVSGQYSELLEAMPYVTPYYVPLPHYQVDMAIKYALKLDPKTIVAQRYGAYCPPEYRDPSLRPYNLIAWSACGFNEQQFYDTERYPVALKRSHGRELRLIERLKLPDAPVGLALHCAQTSPLPTGESVFGAVIRFLNDLGTPYVNLCGIRAERIQDMLAILERCRLLVLEDSVFVHLAAATRVPVIAIQPDDVRRASALRCVVAARLRYGQLDTATPLIKSIAGALGASP